MNSNEKIICHSCRRNPDNNVPIKKCSYCGRYVCGLCKVIVENEWVCDTSCWKEVKENKNWKKEREEELRRKDSEKIKNSWF